MRSQERQAKAEAESDAIIQKRFAQIGKVREHSVSQPLKKRAPIHAAEPWTCPTCNRRASTSYCPTCGESPLRPHDLTLRGFLDQIAQALTDLDGPLLRSFRCLVTRPGLLTVAYLQGQRKQYTLPLRLFLAANVLFFAAQSLVGVRIFSTPLDAHLHNQFWSGVAQQLVTHRLEAKGTTLAQYAPVFDQAVALNAKALIVLMVLPFAALPPLVFFRNRLPFAGHIAFSLHFYAFLLLLFCVALAVTGADVALGGAGLASETFDHVLSLVDVGICAAYLYFAAAKVYGARGAAQVLQVSLLVLAAAGIVLGYRFVLFLLTLYTT